MFEKIKIILNEEKNWFETTMLLTKQWLVEFKDNPYKRISKKYNIPLEDLELIDRACKKAKINQTKFLKKIEQKGMEK